MSPKEDDDIDLTEGQLPPDPPTEVAPAEFDGASATLKWKAPENDGGAPVKEYIIEYRQHKTEEWAAKSEIKPAKFPNGVVDELTTNTKYEFRVRAASIYAIQKHTKYSNYNIGMVCSTALNIF